MDNQEKQRDAEQEEKALKLFELLQNVPEDLLERSDKRSPGVVMVIQKYRTTLVACLMLLLVGAGVLGYRSVGGFGNETSNEMAMDAGYAGSMESAKQEVADEAAPEEAEPEYEYVAENDVVADQFQEALKGTGSLLDGDVVTEKIESAAPKEDSKDSLEAPGLTVLLGQLEIPEGYQYQSITSALREEREVLAIRLQHSDGKYMELVMESGEAQDKTTGSQNKQVIIEDGEGNPLVLAEDMELPADQDGVSHLKVFYEQGRTVQYNGTADAGAVYRVLESLK